MAPYVLGVLTYPLAQFGGLVLATALTAVLARSAGLPVRRVLAAWAVLASAAVGAAILSAPSFPPSGGFRYPAVAVAVLLAVPVARRALGGSISLLGFGDLLAAPLAVGLGVAKTACFFHGCCHGPASRLPWAMSFPRRSAAWFEHVDAGLIDNQAAHSLPVHPLPLYLALWALLVGVLLLRARRRKAYDGQLVLLALAALMAGWFVHEIVKVSQNPPMRWLTLVIALLASAALLVRATYGQLRIVPLRHIEKPTLTPTDDGAVGPRAVAQNDS